MKKKFNPLVVFIQEHSSLLLLLKKLNAAAQSIEREGVKTKSVKTINDVIKVLEEEISHHNVMEEEALFPVLEQYVEGPTELLVDEHKLMKKKFLILKKTLAQTQLPNASKLISQKLVINIRETVQVFVNHIHKENYILFPLLKRFLSKEELDKVASKMR
ncbi:MAG: hemerythrin domain-containing protein [Bacteroidota bacterium]|nr:hemerythrin domain-containing protein [Bacteroidota bacterium]